jgi:hypothetical protein
LEELITFWLRPEAALGSLWLLFGCGYAALGVSRISWFLLHYSG